MKKRAMSIRTIIDKQNPTKKDKEVITTVQAMFDLVENNVFDYFTRAGYKEFQDFVKDSEVIFDSSSFVPLWKKERVKDMACCKNFEEFFNGYDVSGNYYYVLGETAREVSKNVLKNKLNTEAKNYEEITDYYIFTIYQQLYLLENYIHNPQLITQAVQSIITEWYNKDMINGCHLLINIHNNDEVDNGFSQFFEYLENNMKDGIDPKELHKYLTALLEVLDKQKRKILAYLHKTKTIEPYKNPDNNAIFMIYSGEKCFVNWRELNNIMKKVPTPEEKLLQLFLREYGRYIISSSYRENLTVDYHEWENLYTKMLEDNEIISLLNVIHIEYGQGHKINFGENGFADLFQSYYYNLFRHGEDKFSELNKEKEFLLPLLSFLKGTIALPIEK